MKVLKKPITRYRKAGFSLIEILISLVILAVALLSLALIPSMTTKMMMISQEKENATLLALRFIEEFENEEILSADYNGSFNVDGFLVTVDIPGPVDFTSRTITVTVEAPEGIGRNDVSLTRVVSPYAHNTAME
ncbi:MAG: prepilin-type N-terminal cleavage/methylation domain-containing protein [Synergistales bacterium]|nr:prepilin-type N-terminal cleavage/methylation domain-containing protein [Synergistales bacterium]